MTLSLLITKNLIINSGLPTREKILPTPLYHCCIDKYFGQYIIAFKTKKLYT